MELCLGIIWQICSWKIVLIVELKACRALVNEHIAQLLGYLRACRIEHGLLINFGAPKLEIKKYALSDTNIRPRKGTKDTKGR